MSAATLPKTGLAFRAEPRPFRDAVAWVARHIVAKPVIPTLAGALLEVEDGRLTVSAFDYQTAVRASVDVVGETQGRALVSGRLLAELVKTLPDKPVDVEASGSRLTLRCGGVRVTFPLMLVSDYPTLPDLPPVRGTVAAEDFAALVERVAVAADRDGSGGLKWLIGMHLVLGQDRIDALATDRYRAAVGHIAWKAEPSGEDRAVLLPVNSALDIAKAFTYGDVAILADKHVVGFTSPDRTVVVRQLAEEYPTHVKTLIPDRSDDPIVLPVADLAVALKRAQLVGGDSKTTVTLSFTAEGLAVHAKGDLTGTDSGEVIDCAYAGEDVAILFSPYFLADALGAMRSDEVELSFTTPKKPVLLTVPGQDDQAYRHTIVPRHLT